MQKADLDAPGCRGGVIEQTLADRDRLLQLKDEQIQLLNFWLFGPKGEKLSPQQIQLLFQSVSQRKRSIWKTTGPRRGSHCLDEQGVDFVVSNGAKIINLSAGVHASNRTTWINSNASLSAQFYRLRLRETALICQATAQSL